MTTIDRSSAPAWVSIAADIVVPPRRLDITMCELDGEIVLSEPETGEMYYLNQTAATVWEGCDGATTTRAMAQTLVARNCVSFDEALDHVEQVVAWLAETGLLQMEND